MTRLAVTVGDPAGIGPEIILKAALKFVERRDLELVVVAPRACIEAAEALHPGFRTQLLAASGEPHRFVRFALNGTLLQGPVLDRAVAPDDVLDILSSIAGG